MKSIQKAIIPLLSLMLPLSVMAESVVATGEAKTFKIGLAQKDKTHPFFGKGYADGFTLDGEQGKPIVLTRGVAYKFDVNTSVRHDFYFSTAKAGWGAGTVTEGIKGQFTYKGLVSITPGKTMPDEIYYACRNHKFMGGHIYIASKGAKVDVVKEVSNVAASGGKISVSKVKNKLMFAGMMLKSSKAGADVVSKAKTLIEQSNTALKAGNNREAMTAVVDALAILKGNKVSKKVDVGVLKGRYEKALENLKGFETSYKKQSKAFKEDGGLDKGKFDGLKKEAKTLAGNGDYIKARRMLEQAEGILSIALSAILKDKQIVDKRDFSNPKDEFKYELGRYKGYDELIPVGIEMKKPSESMKKMMMSQVGKSKKTLAEAQRRADAGNYSDAVILANQAIGEIKRALQLIGVR